MSWLQSHLEANYTTASILVIDSSRKKLSKVIEERNLSIGLPDEWQSWEIYVDIVGFIQKPNVTHLAFVECKNTSITLSHISQLLGYSRVAIPHNSFIISPQGLSGALKSLFISFQRTDVLDYHYPEGKLPLSIVAAKWNQHSNCIDSDSIITGDRNRIGIL